MLLPKFVLIIAIAVAVTGATESAQAQGLLGALLRAARPAPSAGAYMPRTRDVPILELVIGLDKGKWVIERSKTDDSIAPAACRGPMPENTREMLMWLAASTPIASQDLGANAFVVKDGADASNPRWRVAVEVCSSDRPDSTWVHRQTPENLLSSYGMNGHDFLAAADDFIKQTDGSFPPPLTQAEIQQAQTDQKFMFLSVLYVANGEMVSAHEGLLFDTAAECDRYTTATIKRSLTQLKGQGIVISNSVLIPSDDTGAAWLGCIHPSDEDLPAFESYFDTKMTLERAKQMTRFPDLAHIGASRSPTGPSVQSSPVKF